MYNNLLLPAEQTSFSPWIWYVWTVFAILPCITTNTTLIAEVYPQVLLPHYLSTPALPFRLKVKSWLLYIDWEGSRQQAWTGQHCFPGWMNMSLLTLVFALYHLSLIKWIRRKNIPSSSKHNLCYKSNLDNGAWHLRWAQCGSPGPIGLSQGPLVSVLDIYSD